MKGGREGMEDMEDREGRADYRSYLDRIVVDEDLHSRIMSRIAQSSEVREAEWAAEQTAQAQRDEWAVEQATRIAQQSDKPRAAGVP